MKTPKSVARLVGVIGLAGALGGSAAVLVGAQPAFAKSATIHLYDQAVSTGAFGPTSQPLNDRAQPAAGDYIVSIGTDYSGTHNRHSKKPVGSSNLVCNLTSTTSGFCDGVIEVGSSMLLVDHVNLSLTGNAPLKVTGGTGQYRGARGTITASGVGNTDNNDFTVKITY